MSSNKRDKQKPYADVEEDFEMFARKSLVNLSNG